MRAQQIKYILCFFPKVVVGMVNNTKWAEILNRLKIIQ